MLFIKMEALQAMFLDGEYKQVDEKSFLLTLVPIQGGTDEDNHVSVHLACKYTPKYPDEKADIKVGNCLPLKNIPTGTLVHNVELKPLKGGQMARSAGASVQLVSKDKEHAMLKLVSGEQRLVPINCRATIGVVSNPDHQNCNSGKAGRSRWLGKRPHVRGVVMNPVDHPHGGGEGRTSGGRNPVTPWGVPTKGKRTRNNKRTDKLILKRRNSR